MNLVSVIQRILVQFGNVEKNELCFQFQESMNITDLMCLQNYVSTYIHFRELHQLSIDSQSAFACSK